LKLLSYRPNNSKNHQTYDGRGVQKTLIFKISPRTTAVKAQDYWSSNACQYIYYITHFS